MYPNPRFVQAVSFLRVFPTKPNIHTYIHTGRKYEYKSIYYHAFGIANHTNTATKFLTTFSKPKTDLYYVTFPKNVFVKQLLIFRVPEIRYVCNRLRNICWARITSFGTEERTKEKSAWMKEHPDDMTNSTMAILRNDLTGAFARRKLPLCTRHLSS